jgi:hypothetical protein
LTNIYLHNYYYRYSEQRKQAKNLVDSANYTQAKTKLVDAITEHITLYPDSDTKRDFNFGEKIIMQHALNHLNTVIDLSDPIYFDSIALGTKHQSDIVKDSLLMTPKLQY